MLEVQLVMFREKLFDNGPTIQSMCFAQIKEKAGNDSSFFPTRVDNVHVSTQGTNGYDQKLG